MKLDLFGIFGNLAGYRNSIVRCRGVPMSVAPSLCINLYQPTVPTEAFGTVSFMRDVPSHHTHLLHFSS